MSPFSPMRHCKQGFTDRQIVPRPRDCEYPNFLKRELQIDSNVDIDMI